VFQQLKKETVFRIEELPGSKIIFLFRPLTQEEFQTGKSEEWIYLSSNEGKFTIPKTFQKDIWFGNSIIWFFTDKGLQIRLNPFKEENSE
jgi:hypothetical protein